MGTSKQTVNAEIIPYIFYRDVPTALDWLARTFGFTEPPRLRWRPPPCRD
jgi:uncharacterized glyoxalase superfamily protein PhnB